jgi:hypothetical protein
MNNKFISITSVRNLGGMLCAWILMAVLGAVIGSAVIGGCASTKRLTPKIVKIGADECLEIASDDDTKKVCATIGDLVPLLDEILAAQQARLAREGAAPAGSDSAQPAEDPPATE